MPYQPIPRKEFKRPSIKDSCQGCTIALTRQGKGLSVFAKLREYDDGSDTYRDGQRRDYIARLELAQHERLLEEDTVYREAVEQFDAYEAEERQTHPICWENGGTRLVRDKDTGIGNIVCALEISNPQ